MSGGKQSARDKMIGMMYLVLTALLALQVSNSVLEKFVMISETFEATNMEKVESNMDKIADITAKIKEKGNRKDDLAVLDKAKEIRKESDKILERLEGYKKELIVRTGDVLEGGAYAGQKDIDASAALFVQEGEGDVLRDELNGYTDYLRETTGNSKIAYIAKDAKDIPIFAKDENQKNKGFSVLNFGDNTPMVGALASLSQLQADVISEETKALENLAELVGAKDVSFDRIVPMVKPHSKVVAAGTKYEADLFIAASSSAIKPTMTVDGKSIEVVGGMGKVNFTATPGSYDKYGNSSRTFIAAIQVKDTTYTDTIEFIVSKPVMVIQSASVQALYLNCGNELTVNVPALGTSYNPTFSVVGGKSIAGASKGMVTIVPGKAKVTLSVSSGGNKIGSQDFKVKRIPKPEIVVLGKGGPVDLKRGIKMPRSLKLTAKPDESFAQFLPKDAKFRVTGAEITLVRSGRQVQTKKVNSPDANLSAMASQARAGDALVIEIKKVVRRNFKGDIENVANYSPKYLTIRIN